MLQRVRVRVRAQRVAPADWESASATVAAAWITIKYLDTRTHTSPHVSAGSCAPPNRSATRDTHCGNQPASAMSRSRPRWGAIAII